MESSSKLTAILFTFMLFLSSIAPLANAGTCPPTTTKPKGPKHPKHKHPKISKGPGPAKPPVIVTPPIVAPPVTSKPPVTGAPVPPGLGTPSNSPPPPAVSPSCPVDTLKVGACVDLLGGLVHIGVGDPVANQCCPLLSGLVEIEAAVCLCTSIKLKLLNVNIYLPLALQLLLTCGKTPPPDYTCTI